MKQPKDRIDEVERLVRSFSDRLIVLEVKDEARERSFSRQIAQFEQVIDGLSALGLLRKAKEIESAIDGGGKGDVECRR